MKKIAIGLELVTLGKLLDWTRTWSPFLRLLDDVHQGKVKIGFVIMAYILSIFFVIFAVLFISVNILEWFGSPLLPLLILSALQIGVTLYLSISLSVLISAAPMQRSMFHSRDALGQKAQRNYERLRNWAQTRRTR